MARDAAMPAAVILRAKRIGEAVNERSGRELRHLRALGTAAENGNAGKLSAGNQTGRPGGALQAP
jgi:hypothetical protein